MSYTPPANWLLAMRRATVELVTRLRLTTTFGSIAQTYHTVEGLRLLIDSLPLLVEAKHNARELGVWTRKTSVEAYTLRLVDAAREVSKWLVANNTVGKRVQIDHGTVEIGALADYAIAHDALVITDWREEIGEVSLETEDPFSFNLDEERECWWDSGHPLAIIRDMTAAVLPAFMLGDASLNELASTTHGHLVLGRSPYNWRAFAGLNSINFGKQRANGFDLMNEVLWLVRGFLRNGSHQTSGTIKFVDYDPNAASVYDFGAGDFEGARVVDAAPFKINRIEVTGHGATAGYTASTSPEQSKVPYLVLGDNPSSVAHAFPESATPAPKWYEADAGDTYSPWLNAFVPFANVPSGNIAFDAAATSFDVFMPNYFGFCGTSITDAAGVRLAPPVSTIQANHQLSAARKAYFMLTDHAGNVEFFSADAFAYDAAQGDITVDTPSGSRDYWRVGVFSSVTRGIWGSSALDWASIIDGSHPGWLYDVTVAFYFGGLVLQRHVNGVTTIEFRAAPCFYGVEEGDVVRVTDPELKIPNHDGVDTGVFWECLKAEDHSREDNPCILITAAFLRDGTIPPVTYTPDDWGDKVPGGSPGEVYYDASGVTYTDAGGFAYTNF